MRVIAGRYKGRRLEAPAGRDIRPTTDKTKEAIFSILINHIPESIVVDLFSGTGSLGIEALSRGARACIFCEKSREALEQIRDNLDHCRIPEGRLMEVLTSEGASGSMGQTDEGLAVICPGDAERTLVRIGETAGGKIDVVLMDPPYGKGLCSKMLQVIGENDILSDEGIVLCEHRKEEEMPEEAAGFTRIKERRYGISMVSIYEKRGDAEEEQG